jgi:cobalt-zinc-cadmium efflux system outer membrane protein
MFRVLFAVVAACVGAGTYASAQTVLTFEDTIARAREQSGGVVVARARVAEAEAALRDASARIRQNPLLEAHIGPRATDSGRTTDVDVGFSQQFETGGQWLARIAAARAGIEREGAGASEVARGAIFEAATAFLTGVAAGERLQLAEESDTVARQLLAATERRYSAGDIAAIDVNLARIDSARSAATLRAARADLSSAVAALRALLRLPAGEPLELRGSLDLPAPAALEQLRSVLESRPDFAAISAEVREAEAQAQLGRALRRPDFGVRVGYEREAADTVVLGGLTVTLPTFQRGQGTLAAGLARSSRARLQLEVTRQRGTADLASAYAAYEQRAALSSSFANDTLPSIQDNETLARRSYEAGELGLMDYLLIRRDAIETRLAIIERRLETAHSRLTIDYIAGVLR